MKIKKIPMRSCIITREKLPKKELFRIVKYNDEVFIDNTYKSNGRSCYLKKDKEVITLAKSRNAIERALETTIDQKIYDELLNNL